MQREESQALLQFLYAHIARPEFTARVSWDEGQVTMWDNRMLSHRGIADDCSEKRVVQRVSIRGHTPFDIEGKSYANL